MPGVSDNVLIDSTGLPNDIRLDASAINCHNGVVSREVRLIYVVERSTGFPVFFRYVRGNIVDVSTLRVTLNILRQYGVDVQHSILDAGYSSEANLRRLLSDKVSFLTRLSDNKATKKYLEEHRKDVMEERNSFKYGNRRIFMKRDVYNVGDVQCYAYIAVDFARQFDEQNRYLDSLDDGEKKKERSLSEMGRFVLLSSEELDVQDVLPLYYLRQSIEQFFDYAKNDVDLLPLRSNKAETFRGHLLLSFMAIVSLLSVRQRLKTRKKLANMCPRGALKDMRFVKGEVFPRSIVTTEASKHCNLILDELKLDIPEHISQNL
jgi:transposase